MVLVNVLELAGQAYDHAAQVAQQLAQQQAAQQPASDHTSPIIITLIGQTVILITTLAGFAYNIYRENRNRRWDLEDRERARKALDNKVQSVQEGVDSVHLIAAAAAEGNHALEERIAQISALFENGAPVEEVLDRVDKNTQKTVVNTERTVEILTERSPDVGHPEQQDTAPKPRTSDPS